MTIEQAQRDFGELRMPAGETAGSKIRLISGKTKTAANPLK